MNVHACPCQLLKMVSYNMADIIYGINVDYPELPFKRYDSEIYGTVIWATALYF
jgi:hypothetical protein